MTRGEQESKECLGDPIPQAVRYGVGTQMLPDTPGPHPAVLFAHGSGDATRNVAIWNPYFVRLGMAVLSLDKRGAGKSTGDWHTASMDDMANDWLAGVAMRANDRLDRASPNR